MAEVEEFRVLPAGDQAVVIEFENQISAETNAKVRAADHHLSVVSRLEGLFEIVPAYRSLLIYYDPEVWTFKQLKNELAKIPGHIQKAEMPTPSTLEVPVVYGGEYGPDLEYVADFNNLTPEQVIEIHYSRTYLIYMLGFVPGFAYLGGMSDKIATPRLKNPRSKIPQGSVGIAGSQTGVYPIESPGGWQLIGRTPLKFYDPEEKDPFLPKPGNYLRFYPITEKDYVSYTRSYN